MMMEQASRIYYYVYCGRGADRSNLRLFRVFSGVLPSFPGEIGWCHSLMETASSNADVALHAGWSILGRDGGGLYRLQNCANSIQNFGNFVKAITAK